MSAVLVAVVALALIAAALVVHRDLRQERSARARRAAYLEDRDYADRSRAQLAAQVPALTSDEVHKALEVVERMRVAVNALAYHSGLTGVPLQVPSGADQVVPR
jgi:hypothetical protein